MKFCFILIHCLYAFAYSAETRGIQIPSGGFPSPEWQPRPEINAEDNPRISITLEGHKKAIDCSLDSVKKIYICPETKMLVKSSPFGFSVLSKDESNSPKLENPTSVKAGEKILYNEPDMKVGLGRGYENANYIPPPPDLSIKTSKELMIITSFFELFDETKKSIKGSDAFEKIAGEYYKKKQELKDIGNTIFQEKNYQVELSNGQKVNCTRGKVRTLTAHEKAFEKKNGEDFNCSAYKCDDIVVDGKKYQTSMLYKSSIGSFATTSFHLTSREGRGPNAFIRTIKSPNSSIPLKDNSRFLDTPPIPFTPMGYPGMQSLPNALPKQITEDAEMDLFRSPYFMNTLGEAENLCADDLGVLEKIKLAKYEALEKIANLELVQLISIINGGSLLGQYIDPNQAAQLGCYYGGLYLNEEAAKNLDKIKKNIYPDDHVDSTIDMDRATQLFNKAKGMTDIAWDYKPDGCYARAHLMARRFEAEGVRVDKVWIKGNLYVPEVNISWNFHVAPIVYVKDKNGMVKKMVIDPSLFDKPVTVEEWDKKMNKQTIKGKDGSSITAFPFPENAAAVERSALAFSSSDPYLPGDNINMSEEDKLQMANETMANYKMVGGDDRGIYNYPGMPQP